MTNLSDTELMKEMENGSLEIKPFKKENLTPNGIDLTIGEIFIPELTRKVKEGKVSIPARTRFLISTREMVRFGPQLVGECWIRTTFARKGFIPAFGKIDAGFQGTLTLCFFNSSHSEVLLSTGTRIAQLIVQRLGAAPSSLYHEKSGNYQGQKGIVMGPEELRRSPPGGEGP